MKDRYLEVTLRKGKALVAHLHLPRSSGSTLSRSEPLRDGILVDFDSDGTPIGLEITTPNAVTAAAVNDVLSELGLPPMPPEELSPLMVA